MNKPIIGMVEWYEIELRKLHRDVQKLQDEIKFKEMMINSYTSERDQLLNANK